MTRLALNEESEELTNEELNAEPKGFWRRQFQTESTGSQKTFDWLFGVILPVICFVFDPIVFKNGIYGTGGTSLGDFKLFAYLLSFVSVMTMAAWLIWGAKLNWVNAFFAGLFLVGGLISLGIGIIILPISLIGLLIIIGILGFTPLFTAIVFLRNAVRASHAAKPLLEKRVLIQSVALSALFSTITPWVLNVQIKKDLSEMLHGDVQIIRAKTNRLKYVAPLINLDSLAKEYRFENQKINPERKAALAEAYRELTGENLDRRVHFLTD